MRETPGPSPPEWDEPGLLSFRELARAFHAGEDVERLGLLLRRWLRPRHELAALREIGIVSIERMLDAPEAEIDVARGALLIAREDDPRLDIARALEKVDALAAELRARLARVEPASFARLAATNAFLFEEKRFTTEAAPDPVRRLGDLHLDSVLARRRGHCLGLSVLYLALGARAGLPLFGVALPGHFFVRWDDGKGMRVNIETTCKGTSFPDGYYVERWQLGERHVDSGLYLGNLARREVLVQVLNNRANCYWDLGDATRAARDLERVAAASRSFAPGFAGQGFLALQRGEVPAAIHNLKKAIEIDPVYARAHLHLGDALLRAGQLEKAFEALRRAIELDPDSARTSAAPRRAAATSPRRSRRTAARSSSTRAVTSRGTTSASPGAPPAMCPGRARPSRKRSPSRRPSSPPSRTSRSSSAAPAAASAAPSPCGACSPPTSGSSRARPTTPTATRRSLASSSRSTATSRPPSVTPSARAPSRPTLRAPGRRSRSSAASAATWGAP